jgi:hypothetical protein
MNGETIKEVKALLADEGAIKTPTALRLTLQLMSDMYEKLDKQGEESAALCKRMDAVEKSSIVLWVQKHPKSAIFIALSYFSLVTFVDVPKFVEWGRDIIKLAF